MMVSIRYETIVTNALIRADAVAILAAPFANRVAELVVPQRETVVTRTAMRCRARAVGTFEGTEGYANIVRVPQVTIVANANTEFVAPLVISARERAATWFETSRTNVTECFFVLR